MVNYGGSLGLKFVMESHTNENAEYGQQPNGLWFDKGPGSDNTDGEGIVLISFSFTYLHSIYYNYTRIYSWLVFIGRAGTVSDADFLLSWQKRAQLFKGNLNVWLFDSCPFHCSPCLIFSPSRLFTNLTGYWIRYQE